MNDKRKPDDDEITPEMFRQMQKKAEEDNMFPKIANFLVVEYDVSHDMATLVTTVMGLTYMIAPMDLPFAQLTTPHIASSLLVQIGKVTGTPATKMVSMYKTAMSHMM